LGTGRREQVFEDCQDGWWWWLLYASKTKATRALIDAKTMHHITASALKDDKRQSVFVCGVKWTRSMMTFNLRLSVHGK
jgi:hypothetical protein